MLSNIKQIKILTIAFAVLVTASLNIANSYNEAALQQAKDYSDAMNAFMAEHGIDKDTIMAGRNLDIIFNYLMTEPMKTLRNFKRADLSGADLRGLNLIEADLWRASLTEANLSGAYLFKANLTRANLTRANLMRANLSNANLIRANLSDANLIWANLEWARLIEANLEWANLSGANLIEADLTRANLTRANLRGADLTQANLSGVSLYGANLREVNLIGTYFKDANLDNADLAGANLTGAYLENAVLYKAFTLNEIGEKIAITPEYLAEKEAERIDKAIFTVEQLVVNIKAKFNKFTAKIIATPIPEKPYTSNPAVERFLAEQITKQSGTKREESAADWAFKVLPNELINLLSMHLDPASRHLDPASREALAAALPKLGERSAYFHIVKDPAISDAQKILSLEHITADGIENSYAAWKPALLLFYNFVIKITVNYLGKTVYSILPYPLFRALKIAFDASAEAAFIAMEANAGIRVHAQHESAKAARAAGSAGSAGDFSGAGAADGESIMDQVD